MKFSEVERLLDPTPLALEMGYERLDDGVLHVANRTEMRDCTGAMLEWWFGSRPGTREYKWWHPLDHVSSEWIEGTPGMHVGSVHLAEESFTSPHAEKLSIQFRDPHEVFTPESLAAARAGGAMSAVICTHGGPGFDAPRTPRGEVIGSRLIHLCRDTAWGMVLRSHFFLGHDLPAAGVPAAKLAEIFPESHAPGLLQHCHDEFTFLSRFLPSIYAAECASASIATRPW